jgi:DDE superfamily endonuclease
MERILHIYELPYNLLYPVICFDEKPCALYGDVTPPILAQPAEFDQEGKVRKAGRPKKIDCEYQRNGACSVLLAVEPLTAWRMVEAYDDRKATTFATFFKEISLQFPDALKIRIVMDNLNTHAYSSFYKLLSAQEAFDLMQKFEFYYTPVKGSWLNMAEIELSAFSRICLDRRLDSIEKMNTEIQQLVKERMDNNVIINWQFTNHKARVTFNRHYNIINPKNEIISS